MEEDWVKVGCKTASVNGSTPNHLPTLQPSYSSIICLELLHYLVRPNNIHTQVSVQVIKYMPGALLTKLLQLILKLKLILKLSKYLVFVKYCNTFKYLIKYLVFLKTKYKYK